MIFFPTASEMSAIDAYTINEIEIPQMVLMEKAAMALYDEITKSISKEDKCLVVVESGNNGGDGVALARILHNNGYKVEVIWLDLLKNKSEAFMKQKLIAEKCGVKIYDIEKLKNENSLSEYKVVVDGIFGVGLKRPVEGEWKEAVKLLNGLKGEKLAIDIPTGISADTGEILGIAFEADRTVTFGYKKLGMLFEPGMMCSGQIIVKDIGFPETAAKHVAPKQYSFSYDEIIRMIPPRKKDSNKGTYGKVLVIAGSKNMCGACRFAAEAAYRTGCGLVRIYTDEANREILQETLPEAMLTTYSKKSFDEDEIEKLKSILKWADIILMGPGLGMDTASRAIVEAVMKNADKPMVIDADGLNIIAENKELLKNHLGEVVITPHMKEMSRITGNDIMHIKQHKLEVARNVSEEYNIITVLKDAVSVVSQGGREIYVNTTGNSGMSKGGSGDVLAGVIAGLMAQHMKSYEAAMAGCYIHGRAGDIARREYGEYSMIARDIIEYISVALGKIK